MSEPFKPDSGSGCPDLGVDTETWKANLPICDMPDITEPASAPAVDIPFPQLPPPENCMCIDMRPNLTFQTVPAPDKFPPPEDPDGSSGGPGLQVQIISRSEDCCDGVFDMLLDLKVECVPDPGAELVVNKLMKVGDVELPYSLNLRLDDSEPCVLKIDGDMQIPDLPCIPTAGGPEVAATRSFKFGENDVPYTLDIKLVEDDNCNLGIIGGLTLPDLPLAMLPPIPPILTIDGDKINQSKVITLCGQELPYTLSLELVKDANNKLGLKGGLSLPATIPPFPAIDTKALELAPKFKVGTIEYEAKLRLELVPVDDGCAIALTGELEMPDIALDGAGGIPTGTAIWGPVAYEDYKLVQYTAVWNGSKFVKGAAKRTIVTLTSHWADHGGH